MKSKTSFFNGGLFKQNMKRFWPLFATYLVILLLTLPATGFVGAFSDGSTIPDGYAVVSMVRVRLELSAVYNAGLALAAAMCVFGFIFNQRSSGMIASMPVKREAVFCTALLSGILPVLLINIVIFGLSSLTLIAHPGSFAFKALLIWLAVSSIQYVFFFGFAAMTAVITGSAVAFPVLYGIFNFLVIAIEGMVREIFSVFIYGFNADGTTLVSTFFSPIVRMSGWDGLKAETQSTVSGTFYTSLSFEHWGDLLAYLAIGILFYVAALLIYRRRRMENCGDVIAIPRLRPVFKYGVAFCAALTNGILLDSIFGFSTSAPIYCVYVLIGAFLGYFGSEMLMNKSFKVFDGRWIGYGIVSAVCVLFIVGCAVDVFGIGSRVPDAEHIDKVRLDTIGFNSGLVLEDEDSVEAVTELNRSIIENKKAHYAVAPIERYYVNIDYYMDDGGHIARTYFLDADSSDLEGYKAILNCDEALRFYTTPDVPVTEQNVAYGYFSCSAAEDFMGFELTPAQVVDYFNNAYVPDVLEGNMDLTEDRFANHYTVIELGFIDNTDYYDFIFNPNDYWIGRNLDFTCDIDLDCTHSVQWIKDQLDVDLEELLK